MEFLPTTVTEGCALLCDASGNTVPADNFGGLNSSLQNMGFAELLNSKIRGAGDQYISAEKCTAEEGFHGGCDDPQGDYLAPGEGTADDLRQSYFFAMQRYLLDDANADSPDLGGIMQSSSTSTFATACESTEYPSTTISTGNDVGDTLTTNPFNFTDSQYCPSDDNSCNDSMWLNQSLHSSASSFGSGVLGTCKGSRPSSLSRPPRGQHPTSRLTIRKNVYVSELPAHWNTEKLRSVCSAYGSIVSAKVIHDNKTNESRGYGFVMFETDEQAALCVRSLNSCQIEGRQMSCRFAHEKAMPSFAHEDYVPWRDLASHLRPSVPGAAKTKRMKGEPQQHQSQQEEEQQRSSSSLQDMEPSRTGRGTLFADYPRPVLQRSHNVFIQGLPLQWNTDKLRSLCGAFGKVELAKVVRDAATSLSCGHGFVLFEREESAALCVERLNGVTIEGRTLACRLAREKRSVRSSAPVAPTRPQTKEFVNGQPQTVMRLVDGQSKSTVPLQSVAGYNKWPGVALSSSCPTALFSQSPLLIAGSISPLMGISPVIAPLATSGVPLADLQEAPHGVQGIGCNVAGLPCFIAVPYRQTRIVSGFGSSDLGDFTTLT
uniref:WGS project CAEQ00000000 data, annotated contig 919 n=1 Tax=Trypanosoma congolense (strain IL3000) TaxID=1068625 RepID=F9WJJ6_TRYCI|nr:unnamed protein product [Trypanosoma congolense IL3000]